MDLMHISSRRREADIVYISDPGKYAAIPETRPASCRACIQCEQFWACFSCKWQESADGPVEFSHADVEGPGVIDCKIEAMTEDDIGHRLLLVTVYGYF